MQRLPDERARRPDPRSLRDLRGGVRLAFDALRRSLDGLETVHERLAQVSPPVRGVRPPLPGQGWSGVVYRTLRGSTDFVGGGVDLALASLQAWAQDPQRASPEAPARPTRDAGVSALNALLGDHLHRSDNPLAIRTELQLATPRLARLLVLAPDLGLDATQWTREGAGLGTELATALHATPACLHFNTGRHVWAVAAEAADVIEQQVARWPVPLARIDLLGHGFGGLVLRSALQQALQAGHSWPALVRHLMFLGTPHAGARAPRRRDLLATASATHAGVLLARLSGRRSDGLDDFVHGRWLEHDRAAAAAPLVRHWPAGVRSYAIAGSIGDRGDDGLVPVASALGRDLPLADALALTEAHRWIARGVDHRGLVRSGAVLQQARQWLSA